MGISTLQGLALLGAILVCNGDKKEDLIEVATS